MFTKECKIAGTRRNFSAAFKAKVALEITRGSKSAAEALFDMDSPAYFRPIKSVALSIPFVAGPYASINCKLTLLKSSIRKTPVVGDQYARLDTEDERFSDYYGSLQSIVTSSAQNDSGMFETNLRDERYLPFESSGVISEWQLELPATSKGQPPYFVLIEKALRDEGTSHHYQPTASFSTINPRLIVCLKGVFEKSQPPVFAGATWTTDAPFRETEAAISYCKSQGILGVEMEGLALYAFAQAKDHAVICFAHVTNQMGNIE